MRLIDADALFAEIKERHAMFADCEYIGDKARRDELSAFMADIINAPTVQAQDLDEICSKCKYAEKSAFSLPCVECGFNHSHFEEEET